jgi:hypothetical protein
MQAVVQGGELTQRNIFVIPYLSNWEKWQRTKMTF